MDAVLQHLHAGSACAICQDTTTSQFGPHSLVKTTCSQPHQLHLQCISRQMEDYTSDRRCFICQQPQLHLIHETAEGNLPLSVYACQAGDLSALQVALTLEAAIIQHDYQGDNLLTIAAEYGQTHCLKELLTHGADPNKSRSSDGHAPLRVAARNGHTGCQDALLDAGANIDAVLAPEVDQDSVIDIVCSKAGRLLVNNLEELRKMSNIQDIPGDRETRNNIDTMIHIINTEQARLMSLDMVLAVIGTPKADKSTTINAIVGAEILPRRSRDVTTIPTLIRHAHDRQEALLNFTHTEPFNERLKTLREKLHYLEPEHHWETRDPELIRLLHKVRDGYEVNTTCTGTDAVCKYLRNLNNLAELFTAFDLDFPFEEYGDMANMPVVNVRFASLCQIPKKRGQLTLLDTPGINDAGQGHTRTMVRNLLCSASAVLAVFDYTQLSSHASLELGMELQYAARSTGHDISVWMNKFDQCDDGCGSQGASKEMEVNRLLKGTVSADHVFPVCSRAAFLAHRALRELEQDDAMPTTSAWVQDFGRCAFGVDWEEPIAQRVKVQEKAEKIWAQSRCHQPLAQAIQAAQAQAHIQAFKSVMAKLGKSNSLMNTILDTCLNANESSVQALTEKVNTLETHLKRLNLDKEQAQQDITQLNNELKAQTKESSRRFWTGVKQRIDVFLEQALQNKQLRQQQQEQQWYKETITQPFLKGKQVGANLGVKVATVASAGVAGLAMSTLLNSGSGVALGLTGGSAALAGTLIFARPAGKIVGKIVGGGLGGGVSVCRAVSLYGRKVVGLQQNRNQHEGGVIEFTSSEEINQLKNQLITITTEIRYEAMKAFMENLASLTAQLLLEMDTIKSRVHQRINSISQDETSCDLTKMDSPVNRDYFSQAQTKFDRVFNVDVHFHPCLATGIYRAEVSDLHNKITRAIDHCWQPLMTYTHAHLDERIAFQSQMIDRIRQKIMHQQRHQIRHLKNDIGSRQVLSGKLAESKNILAKNTAEPLERAIEWMKYPQFPN